VHDGVYGYSELLVARRAFVESRPMRLTLKGVNLFGVAKRANSSLRPDN